MHARTKEGQRGIRKLRASLKSGHNNDFGNHIRRLATPIPVCNLIVNCFFTKASDLVNLEKTSYNRRKHEVFENLRRLFSIVVTIFGLQP